MAGFLCTLAMVNLFMEVAAILLNIIYGAWALFAKWFKTSNSEDLASLKQTLDKVELYVNVVEYTSLAMIPIQIAVILLVRCWCGECSRCRKKLTDQDVTFNNQVKSMNMKRSEFTL